VGTRHSCAAHGSFAGKPDIEGRFLALTGCRRQARNDGVVVAMDDDASMALCAK
jgi:hypothetical protein